MDKLKPCPFCGGFAKYHAPLIGNPFIRCTKCDIVVTSEDKSITQAWNCRYNNK